MDGGGLQNLNATFKDLVDIGSLGGISLDAEIHESYLKLQKFAYFHVLSLLVNNLISVLLEETEDI
jgi:hypothetical protein